MDLVYLVASFQLDAQGVVGAFPWDCAGAIFAFLDVLELLDHLCGVDAEVAVVHGPAHGDLELADEAVVSHPVADQSLGDLPALDTVVEG